MSGRNGVLSACTHRLMFIVFRYTINRMIESFCCDETRALFETGKSRRWAAIRTVATRKLAQLDAAVTLEFLRSPPGNRFEALKGDRAGQYSIRINDQWRICFAWSNGAAQQVEIVDYH